MNLSYQLVRAEREAYRAAYLALLEKPSDVERIQGELRAALDTAAVKLAESMRKAMDEGEV